MFFFQVKAEYIGDFHPDTFSRTKLLLNKYIIIPNLDDIRQKLAKDPNLAKELKERREIHFMKRSSNWLAVDQHMVALSGSGNTCNKMGVTYSDFKWQTDFCTNKLSRYVYDKAPTVRSISMCSLSLQLSIYASTSPILEGLCKPFTNLIYLYYTVWYGWQERLYFRQRAQYMLFTFGKLHSVTNTKFSMPTGHLTFKAARIRKSMIVITLAADNLKIITHVYFSQQLFLESFAYGSPPQVSCSYHRGVH